MVELLMRSFIIPSIHAELSSIVLIRGESEAGGGVLSGGNKGKPENPQTAGCWG